MTLIVVESLLFITMIAAILYFKVLSRPLLAEKNIGPFNIVYMRNIGSAWSITGKIKELEKYLSDQGLESDLYMCIHLNDPSAANKAIPGIVGAVLNEDDLPQVEEPFATATITSRRVASAANGNRIIGLNKNILYPSLRAFMNVNGYTNAAEEYIELYHTGKDKKFGKGFYTEVCTRIRQQTEEEMSATEKYESRGIDAASLLFGGKGRFGKQV